ncbi:hypothetical protein SAMN04488124_1266 [Halogeometricum limi]|uniref:Halobacterial output domain-containing protein n=2 Tax=Halogeometricum limi TaxID=555875 RepID=A0A1I6GMK2_9EURY|nr:hypothetical protein SAMN04488124_1266 [Halogeometricum limi]
MGKTTPTHAGTGAGGASIRECTTLEIVSRVADVKGCRAVDLEPLSNVTDPDALENLLAATPNAEFEIRFAYEGGHVTLASDGTVDFEYVSDRSA